MKHDLSKLDELMVITMEECGELIQECSKAIRCQEFDKDSLKEELNTANRKLWKIEDDIRHLESIKKFNEEFIELARNVYLTNDKRASLKQKLNQITNSDIVEVKSYKKY